MRVRPGVARQSSMRHINLMNKAMALSLPVILALLLVLGLFLLSALNDKRQQQERTRQLAQQVARLEAEVNQLSMLTNAPSPDTVMAQETDKPHTTEDKPMVNAGQSNAVARSSGPAIEAAPNTNPASRDPGTPTAPMPRPRPRTSVSSASAVRGSRGSTSLWTMPGMVRPCATSASTPKRSDALRAQCGSPRSSVARWCQRPRAAMPSPFPYASQRSLQVFWL